MLCTRYRVVTSLALFSLAACSGSGGALPRAGLAPTASSSPVAITQTKRALLIGTASGAAFTTIAAQYQIVTGTGHEDPSNYDMVVFDGSTMSPQAIAASGAVTAFVNAGKAVVLLNNTEADREIGLKGALWGNTTGSSPMTVFFLARDENNVPITEVDIESPVHAVAAGGAIASATLRTTQTRPATPDELPGDARTVLKLFSQRFATTIRRKAAAGTSPILVGSSISAPASGPGQTLYSLDSVVPVTISFYSILDTIAAPTGFQFCSNVTSTGGPGTCVNTANPTIPAAPLTASFETLVNVLLEANGSSYQHKIFARQYALLSGSAWPDPQWIYGYTMGLTQAFGGQNAANFALDTMVGFNAGVTISAGPTWSPTLGVTEVQPASTSNATQVTTSSNHTETVGVSATGGWQTGGEGVVSANWTDAWTWSQSQTIDIQDWTVKTVANGQNVQTAFAATGNTQDTLANLQNATIVGAGDGSYNPPGTTSLQLGATNLNGIEQTAVTSADEFAWATASSLVAPSPQWFDASATFYSGEVFEFPQGAKSPLNPGNVYNYGNVFGAKVDKPIRIDFSNPSLQPPATAPWTLSFSKLSPAGPFYSSATGTVTLNNRASTDTTLNLTYVVQPQQQMFTPSQACPGNTSSFNPGNGVVSNGAPPLTITIPAGKPSATFPLSIQTFNSDTYNIQVVAWLPTINVKGVQLINPQSAYCITVTNSVGQSTAIHRK